VFDFCTNGIFDINVPNGRVKSAVLGRNWEGVGVVPRPANVCYGFVGCGTHPRIAAAH
jgi:hypothetical protein